MSFEEQLNELKKEANKNDHGKPMNNASTISIIPILTNNIFTSLFLC